MADELRVKDSATIRDDILRVISNGLKRRGVDNPATGPGTDYYLIAQSVANEIAVVEANAVTSGERLMPDTTEGEELIQWLAAVGLAKRSAGPSQGKGTLDSTASTLVATGAELVDQYGNKFEVVTGGTYADGDKIEVQSVEVGSATNLPAGSVLRWVSPPAFASSTMALDARGAEGGVDEEDDDTARERLLARLAVPPAGGNWQHVAEFAEGADVEIQKAFVYPAANGPSTTHVALAAYAAASTSRSRLVTDDAKNAAESAVVGEFPENVEFVVTKTTDQTADVAFLLTIPEVIDGGGGWIDTSPWPSVTGITTQKCEVTAVSTPSLFTLQSAVAPVVGQSVSWISSSDFTLRTAKITSFVQTVAPALPTPGQYQIAIDTPFTGVAIGQYIFPATDNTQTYLDAVLAQFAAMGPGEKTNVAGVLPRAYRRPRYYVAWPYSIDNKFLKALTDSSAEVLDAEWAYQNGGTTSPTLPTVISDPPRILVPRRIGFYHS